MVQYWPRPLADGHARPAIWLMLAGLAAILLLGGMTGVPFAGTAVLVALAVPLAWVLVSYPEVTLALFVSAGSFKADPRLQSLTGPVDLTLGLAVFLILGILLRGQITSGRVPWTRELLLALLFSAVVFSSLLYAPSTDYGPDKALRFTTLTMLAFLAPLLVLGSMVQLNRFFVAMVAVGVALALSAVTGAAPAERFTAFQSAGTIALGRSLGVAVLILLFWIATSRGFSMWKLAGLGLVGFLLSTQLGTGARGPFFGLMATVGIAALAGFLLSPRGATFARGAAFAAVIASLLVGMAVAWTSPLPSQQSRERIQEFPLFSLGEDPSSNARVELWDQAIQTFEEQPLIGVGMGGFSTSGLGEKLLYPHNLLLEIASELGLLGLGLFSLLLAAVVFRLFSSLALPQRATGPGLTAIIIVVALIVFNLANAMVSGDLNDARMLWMMFGVALATLGIVRFPARGVDGATNSLESSLRHESVPGDT